MGPIVLRCLGAAVAAIFLVGCSTTGSLLFISNADGDHELYVFDGHELQQLTDNSYDDLQASWSTDGRHIIYTSNVDGNPEIYAYDAVARQSTRLTHHPGLDAWPRYSPDSSRIAFISTRDGYEGLYTMAPDGRDVLALAPDVRISEPTWAPDGKQIAVVLSDATGRSLALIDATGGEPHRLTAPGDGLFDLSFSPDGRHLLYAARRDKNVDIYSFDLEAATEQRLTTDPWIDAEPAWSPQGDRIAWVSARDDRTRRQLYVMSADGNNKQRLSDSGVEEMHPRWSPDGRQLAYVAYHQRRFALHVLDVDSKKWVRIDDGVLQGFQFQPIFNPIRGQVNLRSRNIALGPQARLALSDSGGTHDQ